MFAYDILSLGSLGKNAGYVRGPHGHVVLRDTGKRKQEQQSCNFHAPEYGIPLVSKSSDVHNMTFFSEPIVTLRSGRGVGVTELPAFEQTDYMLGSEPAHATYPRLP